jgi:hypothetical protein
MERSGQAQPIRPNQKVKEMRREAHSTRDPPEPTPLRAPPQAPGRQSRPGSRGRDPSPQREGTGHQRQSGRPRESGRRRASGQHLPTPPQSPAGTFVSSHFTEDLEGMDEEEAKEMLRDLREQMRARRNQRNQ